MIGDGRVIVIGVDPGTDVSGLVVYDPGSPEPIVERVIADNDEIKRTLTLWAMTGTPVELAIEWPNSMGMPVGQSVFWTCWWVGVFSQVWKWFTEEEPAFLQRNTIKHKLCGRIAGVNDSVIRQRLIDLFPADGRTTTGRPSAIGTKKRQGPLYGLKSHMWQALAVAVCHAGPPEQA